MVSTTTDRLYGESSSVAIKAPVVAATNGQALPLSGLTAVGSYVPSPGDRILVKDQADPTTNGIYNAGTGAWARSGDFDGPNDVVQGTLVIANLNSGQWLLFQLTTQNPIIGTTPLVFVPFFAPQSSLYPGPTPAEAVADVTLFNDLFPELWPQRYFAALNGVTDDAPAWITSGNVAQGREIPGPCGLTRITQPITNTTANDLRIKGATTAYLPQMGASLTSGAAYNDLPTGIISTSEYTVFLCDGCNLTGAPDSGTMNGSGKLRALRNVVAWSKNGGANQGIYSANAPNECVVEDCTFVLFGQFGVLGRGGEYQRYANCAFLDCGWNLAESGTFGPTYYSGCGMRFISNFTAGDYHTVVQDDEPTVLEISRVWFYVREDTDANKSGMRGLQTSGVIDLRAGGLGGFTGNLFYLTSGKVNVHHTENYHANGLAHNDGQPKCFAIYDCNMDLDPGYEANFGNAASDPWLIGSSGTVSVGWQVRYTRYGMPAVTAGKLLSRLPQNNLIQVATPGGTDTFTFPDICQTDLNAIAPFGFFGDVAAMVQDVANAAIYTARRSSIGAFSSGGGIWQDIAETNISNQTTSSGGFSVAIAFQFSSGDLQVKITWGGSWEINTQFYLAVGLIGIPCVSI